MRALGISSFSFSAVSQLIVAAGALLILLGATALAGWLANDQFVLHLLPDTPKLQFVTALAFSFCGVSFIASICGRHNLAATCAVLVLLIVAITCSPQLFSLYANIEHPTPPDYIAHGHSSGMTTTSALAFIMAGIGLLCLSGKTTGTARCIIGGLTATIVLVLGGSELLDFLAGRHALLHWEPTSTKSAYSATGNILLGLGLTLHAFHRTPGEETHPFRLLAAIILAGTLGLTLMLWNGLKQAETKQLSERVDTETLWLGKRFQAALLERVNAMERMAQRWESGDGTPQNLWRMDAAAYIQSLGGLRSMLWVDTQFHPRWVIPETDSKTALGLEPQQERGYLNALQQARRIGAPVFFNEIPLANGKHGTLLIRALSVKGRFDGYLIAIFHTEDMLVSLSEDISARGFYLNISESESSLYKTGLTPKNLTATNLTRNYQINGVDGIDWRLSLWPAEGFPGYTAMPGMVLASGLALTILLSIVFWLWENSLKSALRLHLAATVYENSHEAIIITDVEHKIISVNQAYTEITGYASHEVIGKNPRILPSGRHDASFYRAMWACIGENGYWIGEIWNCRKNGEIYPGILSITAVQDGHGRVLHYIGMLLDISERKNAETALDKIARQTQAILDNVAEGIITADNRGVIKSFNLAAERIFGYSATTIIGRDLQTLMPDPYRGQHDQYLQNCASTCSSRIIGMNREVQGRHARGSIFPMEIVVSEIGQNDELLFIGLVRDITARKHAEQALIAAKEQAESASLAKSQFLSAMSHELRTPMNAVLGFAQLMEIDESLSPASMESVEQILKAGRHLLALINDVLDLSKIESGSIQIALQPVDCAELVEECLAMIVPVAESQGIRIHYSGALKIMACADRIYLKQTLINLLSNAIKYNRPDGSVRVLVDHQDNEHVSLSISDTGYGIATEFLPRIFTPFERLETTPHLAAIEGTGIGLSICKRLVEAMHGSITVDSTLGSGSIFRVILPTNPEPEKADSMPTLLHITGNLPDSRQLHNMLAQCPDLFLINAHTLELGITLAQKTPPDLILLDINALDMRSGTALQLLREHPATRAIPVLASTTPADMEQAQDAGFDGYLAYPVDRAYLLHTIDRHLGKTTRRMENTKHD